MNEQTLRVARQAERDVANARTAYLRFKNSHTRPQTKKPLVMAVRVWEASTEKNL